ncbi:uncharacterized protein BJX67DRAFT_381462 [Aspergillus lucknowensis]|uniref:Glycosyltransferase family 2 protein n=1 Tax=Aspergillus lucknowensis TaxID=176173 RepID=A0ABR4LQM9_9EURO
MGRLRDVESVAELNDGPSQCQSWTSIIVWCAISYCCMFSIFIGVCCPDLSLLRLQLLPLFVSGSSPALFYAFSQSPRHFRKPKSLEIVALVPFRHKHETEILDCYLLGNLAANGGFLDRVIFIPQTTDTESLAWLTTTVEGTSSYSVTNRSDFPLETSDWGVDALFVWIDGAVFLEDHTIPTMVKTKLDHPDSLIVSANVVNQGALERLHSHPSVTFPYLPGRQLPQSRAYPESWRASALLSWRGLVDSPALKAFTLPLKEHYLPPTDFEAFDHTPIGKSVYSDGGPGWDDWTVKAQQHYSFLHHLELGDLNRYKFPMWANPTAPISTHFFCFMGDDAPAVGSFVRQNDVHDGTAKAPENENGRGKDIIIDGKGLVAHYSSGHGLEGLKGTDVLQKYRSYAREKVCPKTL